jgi:hypothetical protein
MAHITPEFLMDFNLERDITAATTLLEEHSPCMHHILLSAAQTPRAVHENTKKIAGCIARDSWDASTGSEPEGERMGKNETDRDKSIPRETALER